MKIKTNEEMHEMSLTELKEYIRDMYRHISDAGTIRDYREQIGEPKLLAQVVDFEEEE